MHLRSSCSLPELLGSSPCEIIANPAFPDSKSDEAKRPCALFKISNEQGNVPVAASYYKTRQTHIRLLFTQLMAKREIKTLFGLRGCVNQAGLFWLLCATGLLNGAFLFLLLKYSAVITLKSIIHKLISNDGITYSMIGC